MAELKSDCSPESFPAIRLVSYVLTDLLILEKIEPIDFVNADDDVISVTRIVSTPSNWPLCRFVFLIPLMRRLVTPPRLLLTVCGDVEFCRMRGGGSAEGR